MKTFYSYKNKMPEENLNLEWNVWATDPVAENIPPSEDLNVWTQDVINPDTTSQSIDNQNMWYQDVDLSNVEYQNIDNQNTDNTTWDTLSSNWNIDMVNFDNLEFDTAPTWSTIDNSVFLDSWDDNSKITAHPTGDTDWFGKYLRLFFWASVIATIWIIALILIYSFNTFITKASQNNIDPEYATFVEQYKDKLWKFKNFIWKNNIENYSTPSIKDENAKAKVNEIINATDIDYIEKKDLLSPFVSELARDSEWSANQIEVIKQDIARQWFLPEEINNILSEEQAIDTIQRSMNALEVIRFSTASKVFSYMDSAINNISDMIRVAGSSPEAISNLLNQLNLRWEKDISAYVYMCYLNPFETNANCDTIWDLDLYYNNIIKDTSLNIRLFKNAMNAINQILEKEDSSLFSITFNWFNAQDKDITFNIEVYTNQNDERSLIAKWQKNPNIFILTNIINLLKQSSFIIWGEIFTKEINIETKTITLWWISTKVNYSSKNFTVPLQKNTEREIFDYIDLDNLQKLLKSLEHNPEENDLETVDYTAENTNNIELNDNPDTTISDDENNPDESTDTEEWTELQDNEWDSA